jgi:hypothetical protein
MATCGALVKLIEVVPPVARTFIIEIDDEELSVLGLAINAFRNLTNISEGRFNTATELQNSIHRLIASNNDGKADART